MRCNVANFLWKSNCPKKDNIFNWLVSKNKVLSLDNLELRRCNKLQIATCVMCHAEIESVDHLFLHWSFARDLWDYFCMLLFVPEPPNSMQNIWSFWRKTVRPASRFLVDLVIKASAWNNWLGEIIKFLTLKLFLHTAFSWVLIACYFHGSILLQILLRWNLKTPCPLSGAASSSLGRGVSWLGETLLSRRHPT